ncbi:uncharacterized protein LODBEIA_P41930 [Lodderomyces beijingensis]|uniref:Serine/threonine-protein kinase Tel1 n=1 Tax=Lodderomyces beijingensis TaxID=1775926 RepID=A0ABP0ZP87_9ASCO
MTPLDIAKLASSLQSTKVKERNDALAQLESVAGSKYRFSSKGLRSLAAAIFKSIELESRAFKSSQSNSKLSSSVDSRLNLASYSLRLVVERSIEDRINIKYKVFMEICAFIKLFFHVNGEILAPCAVDFAKILSKVLAVRYFTEHLNSKEWTTLYVFVISVIEHGLDDVHLDAHLKRSHERIGTEFWKAMENLLMCDSSTCCIQMYQNRHYLKIVPLMKKTAAVFRKESPIYVSLFKIINKLVPVMATENFKFVHNLIKLGFKLAVTSQSTKWESLQDVILTFFNLSTTHRFITLNNLPKQVGGEDVFLHMVLPDESSDSSPLSPAGKEDEDQEDMISRLEQLVLSMTESGGASLSPESVGVNPPNNDDVDWFKTTNIHLLPRVDPKPWLHALAVTKLLQSYFKLKKSASHSSSSSSRSLKYLRRPHLDVIQTCLFKSSSVLEFCNELLNTRAMVEIQIMGLKVLTFYVELFHFPKEEDWRLDTNDIPQADVADDYFTNSKNNNNNSNNINNSKDLSFDFTLNDHSGTDFTVQSLLCSIVSTFDSDAARFWSLLSARSVIMQSLPSAAKDFIRSSFLRSSFMLALSLLNKENTYVIASNLIFNIVESNAMNLNTVLDESSLTQLDAIIDLPEINGPHSIHDESFKFWYALHKMTSQLNLLKRALLPRKVEDWLTSKWNSTFCSTSKQLSQCMTIPSFLLWLEGSDIELVETSDAWTDFCAGDFSNNISILQKREQDNLERFLTLEAPVEKRCPRVFKFGGSLGSRHERCWIKVIDTFKEFNCERSSEENRLRWLFIIMSVHDMLTTKAHAHDHNHNRQDFSSVVEALNAQITSGYDVEPETDVFATNTHDIIQVWLRDSPRNKSQRNTSSVKVLYERMNQMLDAEYVSGVDFKRKRRLQQHENEEDQYQDQDQEHYIDPEFSNVRVSNSTPSEVSINCDLSYLGVKYNEPAIVQTFRFKLLASRIEDNVGWTGVLSNIVRFMEKLRDEHLLPALLFTVEEILPDAVESPESADLVNALVKLIGSRLLSEQKFEKNELVLVAVSKLLTTVYPVLSSFDNAELTQNCNDVLSWIHRLGSEGFITMIDSSLAYVNLLLRLALVKDADHFCVQTGVEEIGRQFSAATNSMKVGLVNGFSSLIHGLSVSSSSSSASSLSQQEKIYATVFNAFGDPQSSVELGGSYMMFFSKLAQSSSEIFRLAFFNLLECFKFPFLVPYLRMALQQMIKGSQFRDAQDVFCKYKMELFRSWWLYGSFPAFPFQVFGYETLEDFMTQNYRDLTACVLATKCPQNEESRLGGDETFLSKLAGLMKVEVNVLVADSIPLAIAQSYTRDGAKNQVFEILAAQVSNLRKEVQTQLPLIVLEIIKLMGFSREAHIDVQFPKNKLVQSLIDPDSRDITSSSNLVVSLKSGKDLIEQLTTKYCPAPTPFWSAKMVYFLLRRVSMMLGSECISSEQRLLVLRRIKWIILVAGDEALLLPQTVKMLALSISPLLTDDVMTSDVLRIFASFGRVYSTCWASPETLNTVIEVTNGLMSIFKPGFCPLRSTIVGQIEEYLHNCQSSGIKANPAIRIIEGAIKVLNQQQQLTSKVSIESVMACLGRNPSKSLLLLVSNIFDHVDSKQDPSSNYGPSPELELEFELDLSLDQAVTEYLVSLPNSRLNILSESFRLWISTYLANFYFSCQNAEQLDVVKNREFEGLCNYDDPPEVSHYSDAILKLMEYAESDSCNCENAATAESIIAVLLDCYYARPQDISPFVNGQLLDDHFAFFILPMNLRVCALLIDEPKIKYPHITLSEFAKDFEESLFTTYRDNKWCVSFYLAILSEISAYTEIGMIMGAFVIKVPKFAEETLDSLICWYLKLADKKGEADIIKILNAFPRVKNAPISATRIFLKVILSIRSLGKKSTEKGCHLRVFNQLNVGQYYQLASKCKVFKSAIMLFEDVFFNAEDAQYALESRYDDLQRIYENLDSQDLVYGLPVRTTLDHALSTINRVGMPQTKSRFNSGCVDVSLKLNEAPDQSCIQSMAASGMLGISQLMSKSLDSSMGTDESYEWSWKLSKWDMPAPAHPTGTNETVYAVLKRIRDNPFKSNEICKDSLLSIMSRQRGEEKIVSPKDLKLVTRDWIKSLAVVHYFSNAKVGYDAVQTAMKGEMGFEMVEDAVLARQTYFQLMAEIDPAQSSSRKKTGVWWKESLIEVVKYNNLARVANEEQKMISSALLIDGLIKKLQKFDTSAHRNMMNLAIFQQAQTLWSQGNANVAVLMLKELYNSGGVDAPDPILKVDKLLILAMRTQWMSESRQELASSLMAKSVLPTAENAKKLTDPRQQVRIFHIFAKFCESQSKSKQFLESINVKKKRVHELWKDFNDTKRHPPATVEEIRSFNRYLSKMKAVFEKEKQELYQAENDVRQYSMKAVEFYLESLSMGSDSEKDLDKFVALWLELFNVKDLHNFISAKLLALPTAMLLSWCAQLVSRLVDEQSPFQAILKSIISNMCFDHPYHSLHMLISLKMQEELATKDSNAMLHSRVRAANSVWDCLLARQQEPRYVKDVLLPVHRFAQESVTFSKWKQKSSGGGSFQLARSKYAHYWLENLDVVPPPTMTIKVEQSLDYSKVPFLSSMDKTVRIAASGLSHPKIAKFTLTNGFQHVMIFKGGTDDLRQDFIMQQVFQKVQNLFQRDVSGRNTTSGNMNLTIRTYNVVPLGPSCGLIEFVPNSGAFIECIQPYHDKYDKMRVADARKAMDNARASGRGARLLAYEKIEANIKPVLRFFFQDSFRTPETWFDSRIKYSRGLATSSIVGHILGLGDRHCNNILLDKRSGEPIHIDFGVAFDQGKNLAIPETVPFRLTRDLVDGLGITGVEGVFKRSCEHTMRVLRENKEHIMSFLDVLRWDPFYSWTLSPLRKKRLQDEEGGLGLQPEKDGSEAERALSTVSEKLDASGLNVEAAVRELIQEATSTENLAVIFKGWSPFF